MKKVIIAVCAVAVVAVASMPYVNGILMEKAMRQAFQKTNEMYGDTGLGYSLQITKYERGYSTSDVEWEVRFDQFKALYKIDKIIFTDHAKHGLTSVVSTTSLDKNPWYEKLINDKLQGEDPLHISTKYGLLGDIESTVSVDSFTIEAEDETINVKPANLITKTDYHFKKFNYSGEWEGMSVADSATIGHTTLTSDLEMLDSLVWIGDMTFGVDGIDANIIDVNGNENQLHIKKFDGKYLLSANDDKSLVSGEALWSIEDIETGDFKVDNASANFAINNLNVERYKEFMGLYTKTMGEVFKQMETLDNNDEMTKAETQQQIAMI